MSHNQTNIFIRLATAGAIASMGLLVVPTISHAATVEVMNPSAKTAPGQPKFGEKGAHVVAVQTAIMRNGFTLKGGASGVFDKSTLRSLRSFQKVVGLKVTGVVDANTAKVLKVTAVATTTVPVAPTTPATIAPTTTVATVQYPFTVQTLPIRGAKGDAVVLVQKTLTSVGITVKGGIDGMFGSGTTASITSFQTIKGLPATGVLDAATASALNLIAPTAAAPVAAPVVAPVANVSAQSTGQFITVLPVRGNRGDNVRAIQNALINVGIEVKGGADAVFGGATFVALQKFQTANGLEASGTVNVATAIKLGVMAPPSVQISVFPVQGPCSFENTWHAPRGTSRIHLGVDVIAKEGNLQYAVVDGTITKVYTVGTDKLSGNGIRLTAADGTYFFYGHMSRIADGVAVGTKVKAGQVVGYTGKTGNTNSSHLHFEVHPGGGEAIDPTAIIAAVDNCKSSALPAVAA